jgi:type IV secretory pathway VirJ component
LVSEIEGVSRDIQRKLGVQRYLTPVVAGTGLGGAVALAALRQAPANTVAGAASDGFVTTVPTGRPICPRETATKVEGGYRYGPRQGWPGFVRISPWPGQEEAARSFVAESGLPADSVVMPPAGAPLADRMASLLEGPLRAQQTASSPLGDLPLVEVPVQQPGRFLAVIISGDGGWRDIDKQLASVLQDHGVPVVGLDSLRYFWTKRTPEGLAADLATIIDHYRQAWGRPEVILIGYSFGADVIPAAVNRLPPEARSAVREIALLAASPWADFLIHVSGWFTSGPNADSLPTPPELARLDPAKVLCFYGKEDADETVCRDPALAKAELIETGGGHHFDGDYKALAERILAGAERRG